MLAWQCRCRTRGEAMITATREPEIDAVAHCRAPVTVTEQTDAAEWDRFIWSDPSGGVEQLWGWREIHSRVFRQEPLYLAARRGGAIVGALPLVKFKSLLFGR